MDWFFSYMISTDDFALKSVNPVLLSLPTSLALSAHSARRCHQYIIDAQLIREHLCTIMDLCPKQTFNG